MITIMIIDGFDPPKKIVVKKGTTLGQLKEMLK